jgi:hypothetical protein
MNHTLPEMAPGAPRTARAREIAAGVEVLFPPAEIELPNPLIHGNFSAAADRAWRRWWLVSNAARRARCTAVELIRYPAGTLIVGNRSYLAASGDTFVAEQIAPWFQPTAADLTPASAVRVADPPAPCLLMARYCQGTWGHWVAEMLVKVAIAERLFPGRFLYVVSQSVTEPTPERSYATAILESLAAYGVGPERMARISPGTSYLFDELYDISGVWTDGMHPEAFASLRRITPAPAKKAGTPRRIAAIRTAPARRGVFNHAEVAALLSGEGFAHLAPARLSFTEQVRLFAAAEQVVCSLGSDCTSLLYATPGTRVVTLAPHLWRDGYFINFFQRLGIFHADVRGPSTLMPEPLVENASHVVDPAQLRLALAAAADPAQLVSPRSAVVVDGEMLPRQLGPSVFTIGFGRGGNASEFTRGAWSQPEPGHTWSLGPQSRVALPRRALPSCDLWLELEGIGHVLPPYMPMRPLGVFVNDTQVGGLEMQGVLRAHCRVPARMLGTGAEVVIRFDHPVCPSPKAIGGQADARNLGFGFVRLAFHAMAA